MPDDSDMLNSKAMYGASRSMQVLSSHIGIGSFIEYLSVASCTIVQTTSVVTGTKADSRSDVEMAIEDLCPIRADHFRASHRQGDCFRQLAHFCSGLPTWFCKSDRGLLRRVQLAAGVPVIVRHALRHHWRSQHPFRPS